MKRTRETPQTWTPEDVARQERALERRVSEVAVELDRVQGIHRAELRALRKFRKAKTTKAHLIVPGPAVTRADRAPTPPKPRADMRQIFSDGDTTHRFPKGR